MKIGESSKVVKEMFGSFLRAERIKNDWSCYDVAYILKTCHNTPWGWEKGFSFPNSIVMMKKLHILYRSTPDEMKEIAASKVVMAGRGEWDRFQKVVYSGREVSKLSSRLVCRYEPVDTRDKKYKIAFGNYLRQERLSRGITGTAMAKALGVASPVSISSWESGTSLPQNFSILAMLDRLYGNLFDVLFGICQKNGIHLSMAEKRDVLGRMEEFDDTSIGTSGKKKPQAFEIYEESC